MTKALAGTTYLKDYRAPDFLIDETQLHIILGDMHTQVDSVLSMRRNPDADSMNGPLVLHGQGLVLQSLVLNEEALDASRYQVADETLTIDRVPDQFTLACATIIKPQENTALEGLYKSRQLFCTQCEAEGFRRITYYLDRPDVMSVFTTTITADASLYPVLLSNGNPVDSGVNDDGSHWVRWHDPFRKPSYLFALVAGDLAHVEDHFTTGSGIDVTLRLFVEAKDRDKCDHAMQSLKRAMRWDEEVYGREYDLTIFNIVAVDDFNMGAMENKSLNIFNTACVLATPDTTTDVGFQRVEAVVAHEYFHNWSGNRVTCRDWFQLSLKEGFTVFRDSEFSADMGSRTVKRVEDVSLLRTLQFAEDSSPMAHPVQPDSYMEISNFYTVTVYEKGAEIVRMMHHLLGAKCFRKGCDLYFERHDGQAVTCEHFVRTMEDVSGKDLTQFRRWYTQAGTPHLAITSDYDEAQQTYTLTVEQSCAPTPGQMKKQPYHIPLAMALLGSSEWFAVQAGQTTAVLDITQPKQSFAFKNIPEKPVPSLLRGFSAPVTLSYAYTRDELLAIIHKDTDGFCRWDAAQQLGVQILRDMMQGNDFDSRLTDAYQALLAGHARDKAMVALMLQLPTEAYLVEVIEKNVDVHAIHQARMAARVTIARMLEDQWLAAYHDNQNTQPYRADADQIAQRSLKNTALSYLMLLEKQSIADLCNQQFEQAHNMTDRLAALAALVNSPFTQQKTDALAQFYHRWQGEPLVVNQWLSVQATCVLPGTLGRVQHLLTHPAFDYKNPNKIRALIAAFTANNPTHFHQRDGVGYAFLADQVLLLNQTNPQIAARLLRPLTQWKKYLPASQVLMKAELARIMACDTLSKDVHEVVFKSLSG